MKIACTFALSLGAAMLAWPADLLAQGEGQQRVTVCHAPAGNPANAQTLTLAQPAARAHLAHGDSVGTCAGLAAGRGRGRGRENGEAGGGGRGRGTPTDGDGSVGRGPQGGGRRGGGAGNDGTSGRGRGRD